MIKNIFWTLQNQWSHIQSDRPQLRDWIRRDNENTMRNQVNIQIGEQNGMMNFCESSIFESRSNQRICQFASHMQRIRPINLIDLGRYLWTHPAVNNWQRKYVRWQRFCDVSKHHKNGNLLHFVQQISRVIHTLQSLFESNHNRNRSHRFILIHFE